MFFNRSTIRFGPRGEDIVYERSRRSVEIGFTYVDGARLYLDGLTRWSDGSPITDEDKRRLFADVVGWLGLSGISCVKQVITPSA